MQTILVLSVVAACAFAHFGGHGASPAPLTAEKKAEIKANIQAKLATLSPEAQTAGNSIIAAFEANEGNMEATKTAIQSIFNGLSDSVKAELKSIMPAGGHFGHFHRSTTPSA
ncbi:hypothetical protein PRIPAC_76406 [Pristionchus pacificus]|uniref:Uncharacterized protein n=1 Tax=Pristionchus pacificus TaxID=54126 RepID=A0A454XLL6_PRIPA|nr:hypothetical protein PRIPAC_76406 [Pristionchus pacificus]|eukprot:PDM76765.1 hypothetical protein PRIPAC_42160 [Pristionchus pacificus]